MLTDIQIKNAKPQDKDYPIKDSGNLSIVITTTGSKIWQHRFSIYPNGKRKEVIRRGGEYPFISIKEARAWRDNIIGLYYEKTFRDPNSGNIIL